MSVLIKLSTSLGRRDEVPNQELAQQIVQENDHKGILELVDHLQNKNKSIQQDCIKTLYEIGVLQANLVSKHTSAFIGLLESKNNRLQWGAMTALNTVVQEKPKEIYVALPKIIAIADKGSVITKDHAVNILIKLCAEKEFEESAFNLLKEQLLKSPTNQLPMYAERVLPIISTKNSEAFIKTLTSRLDDIEKESKRKRVEKVIAKVMKMN